MRRCWLCNHSAWSCAVVRIPWVRRFGGARSRAQMEQALKLAPGNPRVRLLAAQLSYDGAKNNTERARQLSVFQNAVDAFETERQGVERIPGWGAPEAWQGLAQVYLDRGDAIAARSALEHALLLMPDYKSAHSSSEPYCDRVIS